VDRSLYIDLGAERLIGAEREGQYIAVEIKSFSSASSVDDLQNAIGQYSMYEDVLEELGIARTLYLAFHVPPTTIFSRSVSGKLPCENAFIM
jgi:hypothetical protein